jgi:hypothetical protein
VARGSSHVEALGSSHVEARDSSHVEAWERATISKQSSNSNLQLYGNALVQNALENLKFATIKDWLRWWNVKPQKGKVMMYKAVRPDQTDFYNGTVKYVVGETVQAPDWKEDYTEECGCGLHCCPHLFLTEQYAQQEHVHLKVEVDVKDLRLPKEFSMPNKIRVKKLKVLEIIKN